MTTIAALRTTYLNGYLHRTDGATKPWGDAECNQYLTDALVQLWPQVGLYANGDVATDETSNLYTVPASIERVARIDVLNADSHYVDRVSNWRAHDATKVIVKPRIANGATLRFYGWKRFAATGSDLLTDLEQIVAYAAASMAYGGLAAELVNSQRQQNLDSGRVVDYPTAIGMASYFQARYTAGILNHPNRLHTGPRAAYR